MNHEISINPDVVRPKEETAAKLTSRVREMFAPMGRDICEVYEHLFVDYKGSICRVVSYREFDPYFQPRKHVAAQVTIKELGQKRQRLTFTIRPEAEVKDFESLVEYMREQHRMELQGHVSDYSDMLFLAR